jgi:hypothetical protein
LPKIDAFKAALRERANAKSDHRSEIDSLIAEWHKDFNDTASNPQHEQGLKCDISPTLLRNWFGEAIVQSAVRIADPQRVSVLDLLRLLDYPNDYVPVIAGSTTDKGAATAERAIVVAKTNLNRQLARIYLGELMDRERLTRFRMEL